MGNGICVKTKRAKRARLKGGRGTTQKKWIFCIEVAFTQGVCLASLSEQSQPDVRGLEEQPQAEGTTFLTRSPALRGTDVITALPSGNPA